MIDDPWAAFPLADAAGDDPWAAFPVVKPARRTRADISPEAQARADAADAEAERLMGVGQPAPGVGRNLQLGAQAVGRGVADLAGTPGDISNAIADTTLGVTDWVAEKVMGENAPDFLDFRFGPSVVGSDSIANAAGSVAEAAGMDIIDPEEMTNREQYLYAANRFGTQGLGMAAGLIGALGARAPGTARNMLDVLAAPYTGGNTGRALTADMAGGAGAGVGMTAVQNNTDIENPVGDIAATMGGGLAGGLIGNVIGAGVTAPLAAARGLAGYFADPSVPIAATGPAVTTQRRVADTAAKALQEQAVNPSQAVQNIEEATAAANRAGAPAPTPGMASGDPGLIAVERGMRSSQSPADPGIASRFDARDQALMDAADERIRELVDPGADLPGAMAVAKDRPAQIAADRDAAALPLLRQAETSGATVDAQPVADILDAAMVGPKRPEVLRALKAARDALNAPGADTLDSSVAGLYESRKAISDLIDGRSESNTGRFAQRELIQAKKALDAQITAAVPEFGQYLDTYKAGSRPLDVFDERFVRNLIENETDLRNTAKKALSPTRYGTENEVRMLNEVFSANPDAQRAWRGAVADVLVDQVTRQGDDVSFKSLQRVYNSNKQALAEIFSPEDMAKMEEAQQLLGLVEGVRGSSRGVSVPTTDLSGAVEGALLMAGNNAVTTGMVMKRIKVAANMLGLNKFTLEYKTARLLERAAFDPELYTLLLKRPVAEGTGPAWSAAVRNQILRGEAARMVTEEDPEDETTDAIMRGEQ